MLAGDGDIRTSVLWHAGRLQHVGMGASQLPTPGVSQAAEGAVGHKEHQRGWAAQAADAQVWYGQSSLLLAHLENCTAPAWPDRARRRSAAGAC